MADHTASVHAAITLGAAPQVITTAITNPPSPRALSVTGNAAIAGNVTIAGTDYAGGALSEVVALDGANTVYLREAFATVTSITVPIQTHAGTDTVKVGYADSLFTLAEARAVTDSGVTPLSSATTYPNADVVATELVVRARFEDACKVAFVPRTVTETLDGNATNVIHLAARNPAREYPRRPLTVSAASIDGVALTATQLAALRCGPTGRILRSDGNSWSSSTGYQDLAVEVTVSYGWAVVPEAVRRVAKLYAVRILAQGELPIGAQNYDDGGRPMRFPYPGGRPHWTGDDEVDSVLLEYEELQVVIA